ncbi:MAG: 50S ribosomal protein L20, partial [Nitrospira sp.]
MPRTKGGPKTRQRRKKRLKLAKGQYGAKSRLFRTATESVDKGQAYAYVGR